MDMVYVKFSSCMFFYMFNYDFDNLSKNESLSSYSSA